MSDIENQSNNQQYSQQQNEEASTKASQISKNGSQEQNIELQQMNNQESQNQNQIQNQQLEQPVENINEIDIEKQTQIGNLVPQILAIQNNLMPNNLLDSTGYNILHHAVSYNKLNGIIPLIKELKIDVDIFSNTKQTPLNIASNYGFLKIMKALIDLGAKVNHVDDNSFSSLLYAVRMNKTQAVLYLISLGADLNAQDLNGCGIVHWAAYNNNTFLLEFFDRLHLPMNSRDKQGYTPFLRAIFNESYDTVKYLLENVQSVIPQDLQINKIKSPGLRLILNNFINKNKVSVKNKMMRYLQENTKTLSLMFCLGSIMMCYYVFITQCIEKLPKEGLNYYINVIFNILVFLYVPILFRFSYKIQSASQSMNLIFTARQNTITLDSNLDYSRINQILRLDNDQGQQQKATFIHYLYNLVENQRWEELNYVQEDSFCPTCLIVKKERMHHCKKCGICIQNFEMHTHWFDKCLDRQTHKSYFSIIFLQFVLFELYLYLFYIAYKNLLTGYKIFYVFEIPYIMYMQEEQPFYIVILFLISLQLQFQNFIDFAVGLYGILYNMTNYEIFNRNKCWYFFQQKNQDNKIIPNMILDFKQRPIKYFKNIYFKNIWSNFCEYYNS